MKKILSLALSCFLLVGIVTPVYAAEDEDIAKALEMIEKTNRDIDTKIEKAVKEADSLHANYLFEIQKLEEGDKVVKLNEEKKKIDSEMNNLNSNEQDKLTKLTEKLIETTAKLEEEKLRIKTKMEQIDNEINAVTAELVSSGDDSKKLNDKLNKLNEKLNKKNDKYTEKTEKFTKDLQKVIDNVYNETLKMSAVAIEKAAQKGVIAECSWKLVRFADQWVWIDPVRVIRFTKG
ncbi:hypothetical protein AWM68_11510 [Fictibacillus phosphorivorans]|uniref:Uncharacterized protein n=1 Tax=Fictibacillus phosphorivorans TaxID=1221500 RepID=A0A163PMG3_9BACL|nr:hypothetical protein [Fictibacillus phosphorivorans]KZE63736.1 hypothetical protein AWM68_11510 [Fictibacillus phosphorivorans]